MPRPEATARAGYYPTPPRVAAAIARYLAPGPAGVRRTIRLLDPCAGTGAAAALIARTLGAQSHGIELNAERAAAAQGCLDHVLATSAFAVRLAHGAFSCLFLNPPYDEDDAKRRLEHAFLTSLTRALGPGGVLVFLLPQRRLASSARYLASHYTGLAAWRFPDPEYAAFRQIVVFGTRKAQPALDPELQARLQVWSETGLAPLPDAPAVGANWTVPALPAGDVLFAPLAFDAVQAASEAQRRGVWTQPPFVEQLWPAEEAPVRPLLPLRRGHLALLIAAGLLNNVVLRQGAQRLLVKGRVRKEFVAVASDDATVQIEREVLRTSVLALDLATGALTAIDHAADDAPSAAERAAWT